MIKENKLKYLISSIIIMLPTIVALIIKESVDRLMWGAWYFTWIMPLVLLAVHTVLLVLTRYIDPVKQSKKIENIIFFIIPALSLYVGSVFIAIMLGADIGVGFISSVLLGVMMIVLGNYMPKAKRNRTFGLKIRWTLISDDNWIATHRLSGRIFVISGILTLLLGLFPTEAMFIGFLIVLAAAVIIPIVYSYSFYRRQVAEGATFDTELYSDNNKKAGIAVTVVISSLLVILLPLMFMGKIDFTLGEDTLVVKPSFGGSMEIAYSELLEAEIEYRDEAVSGSRVMGYGSPKLLYGQFRNDEFGNYTRYTYTNSTSAIIIRLDGEVLVLADESPELTEALYEGLVAKVGEAK